MTDTTGNPTEANGKHPVGDNTAAAETKPASDSKTTFIAGCKIGDDDGAGHIIREIYFKRTNYMIYCADDPSTNDQSDRQILVRYADDNAIADKQIAEVADILPLRNKLQTLLGKVKSKREYYVQIAEALRLGLEHKPDVAKQTLELAIADLQSIRASDARDIYLNNAWPVAFSSAAVLIAIAAILLWFGGIPFSKAFSPLAHLAMASGAGALGALLSIAISVRARTVVTDGDDKSIGNDALLRVQIGVISAGTLYLLLSTGILAQLKFGDFTFKADAIAWQLALLIGFAAGFLERLVPDLLEKKAK